jgi:FrmR/RcnR family transcriptional regulator, repressor of frmRAB operon
MKIPAIARYRRRAQTVDDALAYTVPGRVSFPTMSHTTEHKQELLLRAKRIQGQVEALVRALTEERDCSEVLQVMSAARGAMNSLMAELLEGHIRSHVLNGKQKPTSKQMAAAGEVISMVKSYLK